MMAGPIAFALAETIDKQLANAVGANVGDGDGRGPRKRNDHRSWGEVCVRLGGLSRFLRATIRRSIRVARSLRSHNRRTSCPWRWKNKNDVIHMHAMPTETPATESARRSNGCCQAAWGFSAATMRITAVVIATKFISSRRPANIISSAPPPIKIAMPNGLAGRNTR